MGASDDLYQQVILDHNRRPRNFRPMATPTHVCPGRNPLCGDHVNIYLEVRGERIEDVSFEGSGCAISKASSSMMTEAVKGKTVAEARQLFSEFRAMLMGELDTGRVPHGLGKLTIFKGVREYSSRIKCAGLAWHALVGALDSQKQISTE